MKACAERPGTRAAAVELLVNHVTVCRNVAVTIGNPFASVRALRGPGGEYVVVDVGFDDGFVELIPREAGAVYGCVSEPDGITFDAMNKGAPLERRRFLSSGPLDASVRFTGRIDDASLAALYRGADALVCASLYEGFGLPALEAMACGTPVVCSGTTALGEVAGDAALLVEPESTADIARGLERIVRDTAPAARLREAGPARARRYDWATGVHALERTLRAALPRAVPA
jgi:glycosyltransferase involved in cell wall biosynthesis